MKDLKERRHSAWRLHEIMNTLHTLRTSPISLQRTAAYNKLTKEHSTMLATALLSVVIAGEKLATKDGDDEGAVLGCLLIEADDICSKWLLGDEETTQ